MDVGELVAQALDKIKSKDITSPEPGPSRPPKTEPAPAHHHHHQEPPPVVKEPQEPLAPKAPAPAAIPVLVAQEANQVQGVQAPATPVVFAPTTPTQRNPKRRKKAAEAYQRMGYIRCPRCRAFQHADELFQHQAACRGNQHLVTFLH